MIFNITGSGGTALNFKVVGGTTAPTNPQENAIWVNTDADITSWVFCATQPNEAESGMVWFMTETRSTVSFNALKKNSVMVYPISAKQYISGSWVNVTAKSYQGGEWVTWWNGEYFDNGNQFEGVTGGWTKDGYTVGDRTMSGTTTIGTTMKITVTEAKGACVVGTVNPVDLTDVDTVYFNVTAIQTTTSQFVGVSTGKNVGSNVANTSVTATGLVSVDVSNLSGNYYLFAYANNSTTATTRSMTIDKVYGE